MGRDTAMLASSEVIGGEAAWVVIERTTRGSVMQRHAGGLDGALGLSFYWGPKVQLRRTGVAGGRVLSW